MEIDAAALPAAQDEIAWHRRYELRFPEIYFADGRPVEWWFEIERQAGDGLRVLGHLHT
jgi:hypothetical protein